MSLRRSFFCFASLLFATTTAFSQNSTVQITNQQSFTPPVYVTLPSNPSTFAFYYPWYASLNWSGVYTQMNPQLGRYYSNTPSVIAQHMFWGQAAGLGGFVVSWWGQLDSRGTRIDGLMPALLSAANAKHLQLILMIENYSGRTQARVASDIAATITEYRNTPGWYTTTKGTPWLLTGLPRPVYYIYQPDNGQGLKPASWTSTLDAIHSQSNAIVLACASDPAWVTQGHFDGLFDYSYSNPFQTRNYSTRLPLNAWYVPSAVPGFDAYRNKGFTTIIKRNGGEYYDSSWRNALDQGVPLPQVTITSFNEWFESTAIEPCGPGTDSDGFKWETYDPQPANYYITRSLYWTGLAKMYTPEDYTVADTVYTRLGAINDDHGLYQNDWGSDGVTTTASLGGQGGRTPISTSTKIYLQINKRFAGLSSSNVTVRVDYYDGTGQFYLDYMSKSATYTRTPQVKLNNTKTWKTALFTMTDAAFNGLENGNSDLRISQVAGSNTVYSLVSITKNLGSSNVTIGIKPHP